MEFFGWGVGFSGRGGRRRRRRRGRGWFEADDFVEFGDDGLLGGGVVGKGQRVGGRRGGFGGGLGLLGFSGEAVAGELEFGVFEGEALAGKVSLAPLVEGVEGGGAVGGGGVGVGEGLEGLQEDETFDGVGEEARVGGWVVEELAGEAAEGLEIGGVHGWSLGAGRGAVAFAGGK